MSRLDRFTALLVEKLLNHVIGKYDAVESLERQTVVMDIFVLAPSHFYELAHGFVVQGTVALRRVLELILHSL